jgi:hypothetical protein
LFALLRRGNGVNQESNGGGERVTDNPKPWTNMDEHGRTWTNMDEVDEVDRMDRIKIRRP